MTTSVFSSWSSKSTLTNGSQLPKVSIFGRWFADTTVSCTRRVPLGFQKPGAGGSKDCSDSAPPVDSPLCEPTAEAATTVDGTFSCSACCGSGSSLLCSCWDGSDLPTAATCPSSPSIILKRTVTELCALSFPTSASPFTLNSRSTCDSQPTSV